MYCMVNAWLVQRRTAPSKGRSLGSSCILQRQLLVNRICQSIARDNVGKITHRLQTYLDTSQRYAKHRVPH